MPFVAEPCFLARLALQWSRDFAVLVCCRPCAGFPNQNWLGSRPHGRRSVVLGRAKCLSGRSDRIWQHLVAVSCALPSHQAVRVVSPEMNLFRRPVLASRIGPANSSFAASDASWRPVPETAAKPSSPRLAFTVRESLVGGSAGAISAHPRRRTG